MIDAIEMTVIRQLHRAGRSGSAVTMVIHQLRRLPMIDNDAMSHQSRRSERIGATATTVIR
jgi:hypothetical protein